MWAIRLRAVSPNYFNVAIKDYLDIKQGNKKTGLSLSEQLYTVKGSQSVIISESLRKQLYASLSKDYSCKLKVNSDIENDNFELRVIAVVNTAPGL